MTTWLAAAEKGDRAALDQVFSRLYPELRRLAHARLKRYETPTLLDTTSLVHESYLRFLKAGEVQIQDRTRFLAYSARVMRSVIVDCARERSAQRRGGQDIRLDLDAALGQPASREGGQVLQVHQALEQLATVSERLVKIVEMRYFVGMSEAEIAEALGITDRTVRREWEKARMILAAALK
ncbi:MAG TPA: ECF-type sigma factor [Candidatus Solibacter sp.]|nr:ECF-type sigma factor [Candidatus Solibacter sp.]